MIKVDRRAFLGTLGSATAIGAMSHEARADAAEHYMIEQLDADGADGSDKVAAQVDFYDPERETRRGVGRLFADNKSLTPMPAKPTLVDFYNLRFAPARHVLQSAKRALTTGQPERTILACLLHDVVLNLVKPDHGWWGAQLMAPYVDERVSWGIRYHQALRFFPDPEVGYEYPEFYNRIFGEDYEPDAHIQRAHKQAREHKWYMEARLITMNDEYSFDREAKVSIDPFVDIIGRQFKQPAEGLGNDDSPSSHMWRTIANPNRPL
jgi:hypothetical protein